MKNIIRITTIFVLLFNIIECGQERTANITFTRMQFNQTNLDFLSSTTTSRNAHLTTNLINKSQMEFYKNLGKKMNLIISPILLIIGGLGNPLCIIILLRKKGKNPTVVYLCVLAAFDILVLYTGLLRQYINEYWNYDIRNLSQTFCKLHVFLTYTFMQISSYILVAVSLNRFTIMFNRTLLCKRKSIRVKQTKEKSMKSVFIIVFVICLVVSLTNLHFLIYYNLSKEENKSSQYVNDCTIHKTNNLNYYRFRTLYYGKLHLYLYIVVPCLILFVVNLLIIRKIMGSLKKNLTGNKRSKEARKKGKKRTALSIMLVSVCLWFMILKTPASVYLTFPVQEMSKSYFPFTYSLFMLINYTNHAVNLILYIVTSSSFREDFKDFFISIRKSIVFVNRENKSSNLIEGQKVNNTPTAYL